MRKKEAWKVDFDKVVKQKHALLVSVFSFAIKDNASQVIAQTPVWLVEWPGDPDNPEKPGLAKGAWTMNRQDSSNDRFGIQDKSGNRTINAMKGVVSKGTRYFQRVSDIALNLTNTTPWIEDLEYGHYPRPQAKIGSWNPWIQAYEKFSKGGFSKQAPIGMVGVTAMSWRWDVANAIEKVKAKSKDDTGLVMED